MDGDNFIHKLRTILNYQDLADRFKEIEGFLIDIHAFTLLLLANEGPGAGAIVEIGSYKGKSTCCLALGAKSASREKVYAVDHFTGSPEHQVGEACETRELIEEGTTFNTFMKNITDAALDDYIVPIQASSVEAAAAWEGPIRLLFIDGDHSYEASRVDFESWAPHVVPGGIIVFHDIGDGPGVTRFYKELIQSRRGYQQVVNVSGLGIVEKSAAPWQAASQQVDGNGPR